MVDYLLKFVDWIYHIHLFLYCLIKFGLKDAVYYSKRQMDSNVSWARKDINDRKSALNWPRFIGRFFFLDYNHAGLVRSIFRKLRWKYLDWLKKTYRKHNSLYNEIWSKALNDGFSDSEKAYLRDLGLAIAASEEE